MSSVANTNLLPVHNEAKDMTTVNSNVDAPLDGEFFGRPTRQTSQRFGVIGTRRPSGRVIPHFPSSISTTSSTDFPYPSLQAVHKAEIDAGVLREKFNTTLLSHISSPKVSTAPTDDVCSSDEVFDENQPPALSSKDTLDSDSSSDIIPPPTSRANRKPFSVLFVERQSTRRFSQESSCTNSPPSESARLVILEPKPRLAWHTTYEQLLVSEETSGAWATPTKTDMPRGLARIRAKAPHHIDLWLANKPDEPPDRILVPVKGGSERPCFPRAPLMKNIPLPETTPDVGNQPSTLPITPRRQVLLDMLNYRPTRVYL